MCSPLHRPLPFFWYPKFSASEHLTFPSLKRSLKGSDGSFLQKYPKNFLKVFLHGLTPDTSSAFKIIFFKINCSFGFVLLVECKTYPVSFNSVILEFFYSINPCSHF